MNELVTRYRPKPDEAELKKHIDGANVDGSVILALPTDGPSKVGQGPWDGRPTVLREWRDGAGRLHLWTRGSGTGAARSRAARGTRSCCSCG